MEIGGFEDEHKNIQTVKELYLSNNALESMDGIRPLRFVEILDLSHNNISDIEEVRFL